MAPDDIFERLRRGETIPAGDPEAHRMRDASFKARRLMLRLNDSPDPAEIRQLLGEIIGSPVDPSVGLFPPLYINYGKNIRIGKGVFINFGCTMLGLGGITLEDDVFIGPNVSLLSEGHPVYPAERHDLLPGHIRLCRNVWIGAGATVLAGVTVGENSVVAAGAVVNRDVPPNTVVGGIPARVIRVIETDRK